jgi:hypothetical protein
MGPRTREISFRIPFYSQRVDSWTVDGFIADEEAKYWQQRGCGIACLRMVLDGVLRTRGARLETSYASLISEGLALGAYCDRGWIHARLVRLAEEYGVQGTAFRSTTTSSIVAELDKDRPCIASVTVKFEGGQIDASGRPLRRGGHLAVLFGYAQEADRVTAFLVNHPSAGSSNWERRWISIEQFEASFSGGLMSFWPSASLDGSRF